ncbi:helix-turn-helix family protein [Burkholderia pseudomallei MSHR4378]|uniref:XRE family transcriptional regulator n=1 Tax=Burkholderia pseudomallei TaxID=28450 RepID=UPI000531DC54|nr:XRE family transcriptional regulator [Burkholderia pseudomallei]KGS24568.1 helix-turn-helix family protein [Burkholderia pseudomallei MSHR4378]
MQAGFSGTALRTARLLQGFSLEEVAVRVGKTRQYISKLEMGNGAPAKELSTALAAALGVTPQFFEIGKAPQSIAEEQVHFRRLATTKVSVKQEALAKASLMQRVVEVIEQHLQLPEVKIPQFDGITGVADIERAAERCRSEWGIGLGPISNMTRLAENVGAVVTTFTGISSEVDALSFMGERPIIVRNDAKESACRQRFDIAHELGHCVMHQGRVTGDRVSESEANRFASALLVPRAMMMKLFPRARGSFLDWKGISEFKLTWKVSKAALLYRARQLELISDELYRRGAITLRRGEATREREDDSIPMEEGVLLHRSVTLLRERLGITLPVLAAQLGLTLDLLASLLREDIDDGEVPESSLGVNVVPMNKRMQG